MGDQVEKVVRREFILAARDPFSIELVEFRLALDVISHLSIVQRGPCVRLVDFGSESVADVLDGAVLPHRLELVLSVKEILLLLLQQPQQPVEGLPEDWLRPDSARVRGAREAEVAFLEGLASALDGVLRPVDLLSWTHRDVGLGDDAGAPAVHWDVLKPLPHVLFPLGGRWHCSVGMPRTKPLSAAESFLGRHRVIVVAAAVRLGHGLGAPLALADGARLLLGSHSEGLCAGGLHSLLDLYLAVPQLGQRSGLPVPTPELPLCLCLVDELLQQHLNLLAVLRGLAANKSTLDVVAEGGRPVGFSSWRRLVRGRSRRSILRNLEI
mmetsp:Transcript_22383/g.62058  ORF Transcript_22383/g.62058 Transcript_22383/m.62058 type:complete len:325 (+) Transcript_22383:928-1902(+)